MADDEGTTQETPAAEPAGNNATEGVQPEAKETEAKAEVKDQAPLASGDTTETKEEPAKSVWPEDWRERLAEHRSAGDEAQYKKELRRLEKVNDPSQIYTSYREMENTWASRGLVKVPSKDSTPEEIAEFRKQLGVPDKPEAYFDNTKIADGFVLGDEDRAELNPFVEEMHKAGASQGVVDVAINKYLEVKENQEAMQEEADFEFRSEAQKMLKEEFGPGYKRMTQNVATLFSSAPGGADANNDEALFARMLGGRMADGTMIGNDPDFIRWASTLAHEINPIMSVVEDADGGGRSAEQELKEISQFRRKNRAEYNRDEKMQARERELITALDRTRAKA